MLKSKLFHSSLIAGFLAFSSAAQAATDDSNNVWSFTLTKNDNLFGTFDNNAFFDSSMSFDFTRGPAVDGATPVGLIQETGEGGFSEIDFGVAFGGKTTGSNDRLSQENFASWSVTGPDKNTNNMNDRPPTTMYVHSEDGSSDGSAKLSPPAAVPEPETYAMVLAGLGLLGYSARRRKNNP